MIKSKRGAIFTRLLSLITWYIRCLEKVINIESLTLKILDEIHEMKAAPAKVTVTKTGFKTKGKK